MKITSRHTRWGAQESTRKVLRRVSGAVAVLAVMAAAIGVPVMSPQPDSGTNPVLAIARADCPPDCGGGPGNGGTPTGPPGGGTEFAPPSMPAMPSYEPGRGYPAPDQSNGISIYNSTAPQPSQLNQTPGQNRGGTNSRAANGEQQPINYRQAPNNQRIDSDWQRWSDELNQNQDPDSQDEKVCSLAGLGPFVGESLSGVGPGALKVSMSLAASLVASPPPSRADCFQESSSTGHLESGPNSNPNAGQENRCPTPQGLPSASGITWPDVPDPALPQSILPWGSIKSAPTSAATAAGQASVEFFELTNKPLAAALLKHYLDNSGTPVVLNLLDSEEFVSDWHNYLKDEEDGLDSRGNPETFPSAGQAIHDATQALINEAFKLQPCSGTHFLDSGWLRVTAGGSDRYNALGHYFVRVQLAVGTQGLGGADPFLDYVQGVNIYDYYTFEELPIYQVDRPVQDMKNSDNNLIRFLQGAGLAKDFPVHGFTHSGNLEEARHVTPSALLIPTGGAN